jgi:hypothetical protein
MDRDERREAARRQHNACPKCGGMYTEEEVDGSKCDGMPGITYKVCGACGNSRPKTKRQRKDVL